MAIAAIGLFLLSYQWGSQYKHGAGEPPAIAGVSIRPAQPLPDFVLNGSSGAAFGRADLLEHWSLVGFAPINSARGHRSIARLVEVYNRLADQPELRRQLRLILVTADSVPRLALDFERLSPAISVLNGEPEQRDTLQSCAGRRAATDRPRFGPSLAAAVLDRSGCSARGLVPIIAVGGLGGGGRRRAGPLG
jgi:hypothetical protein